MMAKGIFRFIGIDWNQFKCLMSVSIKNDFRRHRGMAGRSSKISPMVWSMIFYSMMSIALAAGLAPVTTTFLYSLLILSYSMVIMVLIVILEFSTTIISSDDSDILAYRPISSRTYFFARLGNLLFYVFLMTSSICFFPSIIGITIKGSSWLFPFLFLIVAVVANAAAASFVVLIYTTLMKVVRGEKFKDIIAYAQVFFTFFTILIYQLVPRLSQKYLSSDSEISGKWLYATPSAWFAGFIQFLLGRDESIYILLSIIAAVSTFLLFFISFRRISMQYADRLSALQVSSEKRDRTSKIFKKRKKSIAFIFLNRPEAEAGYELSIQMFKRDRLIKMGAYALFGMPLAFILITMMDRGLEDPFAGWFSSPTSYLGVFFIFFMIYSFLTLIRYATDWEASWIFRVAPITSPGLIYRGIKLMIFSRFVIPFFVVLGVIYSTQIPLMHALRHMLTVAVFGLIFLSFTSLFIKEYPFSRKRERGERSQRLAVMFFSFPFFILLIFVQRFIYGNFLGWLIMLTAMFVLFIILETLSVKVIDRRIKSHLLSRSF